VRDLTQTENRTGGTVGRLLSQGRGQVYGSSAAYWNGGGGKMPDAKTMGKWGLAVGPQVLRQIHDRIVQIARDKGVVAGRRLRVDTTVVETNIHYPTDSTVLGDGVRVLTSTMKKITVIVGAIGTKLRDRSRSVKLREIGRIARAKGGLNRLSKIAGGIARSAERGRE
jgi:hypothetical protein